MNLNLIRRKSLEINSKPNKILDNLYLGNELTSEDKALLEELAITHILMVGYKLKPLYPNVSYI